MYYRMIQVGPGFLIANQIKDYKDYPSFRKFVIETMDVYYKAAKPSGIRYIGLRYVNRIEMKPGQPLEEISNIGFRIPGEFKAFPNPYLLRMEFTYSGGRDSLIVNLATAAPHENSTNAVILDFEYMLVQPDEINDRLLEWIDEAHYRIEEAFHACLTESVLNSFGPMDEEND